MKLFNLLGFLGQRHKEIDALRSMVLKERQNDIKYLEKINRKFQATITSMQIDIALSDINKVRGGQ